jgi:hypothetical protein
MWLFNLELFILFISKVLIEKELQFLILFDLWLFFNLSHLLSFFFLRCNLLYWFTSNLFNFLFSLVFLLISLIVNILWRIYSIRTSINRVFYQLLLITFYLLFFHLGLIIFHLGLISPSLALIAFLPNFVKLISYIINVYNLLLWCN